MAISKPNGRIRTTPAIRLLNIGGASMSASIMHYSGAAEIRFALTALMPSIEPFWNQPIAAYAAAAYRLDRPQSRSCVRNHAMTLLRAVTERAALKAGYDTDETAAAGRELLQSPVIQTGPHCLLLFEPDAFYTHLFSLLGLAAHRREWHITYFGTTMSFKESAKKGPGWLRIDGEPLNLFGLPRSRMDGRSICCPNGPYRFALTNSESKKTPTQASRQLLDDLPSFSFGSAAEAIKCANQILWQKRMGTPLKLLQLDDFDVAELIADHLDDTGSWMAKCFVSGGEAEKISADIDRLNAGPWRGWIKRTTDHFWLVERDSVVPLRLYAGYLRSGSACHPDIEFTPSAIAAALRDRKLLPSLFTAFLVLSILPGVRALGGCRQTVYLPLMRYLTALSVTRYGDYELLDALRQDERPGQWGHRVFLPAAADPILEVDTAGGISTLLHKYRNMRVTEATGDLTSFTKDAIWAEMAKHLANGDISAGSPEWSWSAA